MPTNDLPVREVARLRMSVGVKRRIEETGSLTRGHLPLDVKSVVARLLGVRPMSEDERDCVRNLTRRSLLNLVFQLSSWGPSTKRRRKRKAEARAVTVPVVAAPHRLLAQGRFFIQPPFQEAWNASDACTRKAQETWPP
jgi:hypothetical protein